MEYISIITFFAGFIISELIRRANRAETFNAQVFNKRLEVYCELYAIGNITYNDMVEFVESVIDDTFPQSDNLLDRHFEIVQPLLKYGTIKLSSFLRNYPCNAVPLF